MATRAKATQGRTKDTLDQQTLKTLLRYDEETGEFIRLSTGYAPSTARYANGLAGRINDAGYCVISIFSKSYRAHQLAWLYVTGAWPEQDIDHINGVRSDNRWTNLRAATRWQNLHNSGVRKDNVSGVRGVSYDATRGKWLVQCSANKQKRMRRLSDKAEAEALYAAWSRETAGEFSRAAA